MDYLRFASRHVQQSIAVHVRDWVDGLGWLGSTPPFGTTPVRFQVGRMDEASLVAITGNLIGVSFGGELDDVTEQLGGGLASSELVVFVDVVGVSDAVAVAVASDVKDLLTSRAPGTSRTVPVRDWAAVPPVVVPGWSVEFTDVMRERANENIRSNWHVVKTTAVLTFPGDG